MIKRPLGTNEFKVHVKFDGNLQTTLKVIVKKQLSYCWLQQLELPNESTQPGSSLSLRVPPVQASGTPSTTASQPANENTDATNNNVMSQSVTNQQPVHRSASSTTNPPKSGQLIDHGSCVFENYNKTTYLLCLKHLILVYCLP